MRPRLSGDAYFEEQNVPDYLKKSLFLLLLVAHTSIWAAEPGHDDALLESPRAIITRDDFMTEISRIPERDRGEFLVDAKRVNAVLEQLYLTRVLAREAEELKLAENPEVMRKLELAREKVLAGERMAMLEKSLKIPDFSQKAREMYLAEKEKYYVEPTARAAHILISAKNHSEEEALKKAQEVRALLVSGSKTFEQAAREFSEDPSAKDNGGELGWFGPKRMVKPFSDAAFAMKPGDISQPVKSGFGYHIILLEEKKEGRQRPFDEVKQEIIDKLVQDYIQAAKTAHMNEIKGDKSIVVHDAEIRKLNPLNNLAPTAKESAPSK